MKADLITKNKLVEYIDLYPEAKTNILLWIKEFGRRLGEDMKTAQNRPFVTRMKRGLRFYRKTGPTKLKSYHP